MSSPEVQNKLLRIVIKQKFENDCRLNKQLWIFCIMIGEAKSHRILQLRICVRYLLGHEIKESNS